MENKFCKKCQTEKSFDLFGNDKYRKDGKRYACKECIHLSEKNKRKQKKRLKYKAIEFENNTKLCTKCGLIKEFNKFYFLKKLNRYRSFCRECEDNMAFKRKYKISDEKFIDILEKRKNNKCEICGDSNGDDKQLSIDHNHDSGTVRGVICNPCNMSIGLLKENTKIFNNMIKYLNKYN